MTKLLTFLIFVIFALSYAFAGKQEVHCTFKISTLQKNGTVRIPAKKYYGLLIKITTNGQTGVIEEVKYLTGQTTPGVGTTYAYPPFAFPTVTLNQGLTLDFGSLTAEESMKLLATSDIFDYPVLYRGFNIGKMTKDKNIQSVSVIEMLSSYDNLSYELNSYCKF